MNKMEWNVEPGPRIVLISIMNSNRTIKILLYLYKMYLAECMGMYTVAIGNSMQFLHDLIYSGKLEKLILCVCVCVCVCVCPVEQSTRLQTWGFYFQMFLLFGLFVTGIQNPALRSLHPVPSALNLCSKDKWCLQNRHFIACILMLCLFSIMKLPYWLPTLDRTFH